MIASSVVVSGPHVGPRRQAQAPSQRNCGTQVQNQFLQCCCNILVSINCDIICDCLTEQACA